MSQVDRFGLDLKRLESFLSPSNIRKFQDALNLQISPVLPLFPEALEPILNKRLNLKVYGLGLTFSLLIQKDGTLRFSVNPPSSEAHDVEILSDVISLLRWCAVSRESDVLAWDDIRIHTKQRGLPESFRGLLRLARFVDWEALLLSVLGKADEVRALVGSVLSAQGALKEEIELRHRRLDLHKQKLSDLLTDAEMKQTFENLNQLVSKIEVLRGEIHLAYARGLRVTGELPSVTDFANHEEGNAFSVNMARAPYAESEGEPVAPSSFWDGVTGGLYRRVRQELARVRNHIKNRSFDRYDDPNETAEAMVLDLSRGAPNGGSVTPSERPNVFVASHVKGVQVREVADHTPNREGSGQARVIRVEAEPRLFKKTTGASVKKSGRASGKR